MWPSAGRSASGARPTRPSFAPSAGRSGRRRRWPAFGPTPWPHSWPAAARSPATWHIKYHALKGFFRFAVSRGHLDEAPLPTVLPKRPRTFVPYIYSRDEIRRLLDAIPSYRRYRTRIEPETLRAILLLLYGAGLRVGEALNLSVADVDLPNALLTIRDTKFFKSRLVPIGRHLTSVLTEYARWRAATHPSAGAESRFFLGKRGARDSPADAGATPSSGSGSMPGCGGPTAPATSLGCTTCGTRFAVHRLTEWYRQGADVQRLLHHLSVYLGHAHLAAHAGLPDHDAGAAAAGRHAVRAVRPRGGRPCVTLPCSGRGFAGS